MNYLTSIVLVLLSSLVLGEIALRINLPRVVGQISAGILIGPLLLNWVQLNGFISTLADLGIIILMMLAGLECDFNEVKSHLKTATLVAFSGVILPLVGFFVLGKLLNQSVMEAILWGVIFSATSVSITVAVLQEMGKLKTSAGAIILGAAVVDDIISILLLSGFSSIYTTKSVSFSAVIGLQITYVIFVYIMTKWMIPEIVKLLIKLNNVTLTMTVALIVCLAMAELAEICHLSAVLGAFCAGVAIAMTPMKAKITNNIEMLGSTFLIPFFFVSIGLELKLVTSFNGWMIVLLMTSLAILTKWIGCGIGAKLCGTSFKTANIIGTGMVSRGEMALIVAQVAVSSHLLSTGLYSEIILVIILSTIISPILLKWVIAKW